MAFLCPTKTCNPCNSCNPQFDSSTLSWQFRGIESRYRFLAVVPAISRSHPLRACLFVMCSGRQR